MRRCRMGPALPRRERDPGGADDLVGADEALPVSREKALRAGRVELRQPCAKPAAAEKPMELESLLPDRLGDFGNGGQTVFEGTEVKAGAANENR
jgi:hypothetical protein